MADNQIHLQSVFALLLLASLAVAQQSTAVETSNADLVKRTLAAELVLAQDASHPMRYRLYKATPRLSSVKEICETRDGSVARLIEINGHPLSQSDEQKEEARLEGLLQDPGRQRHRKQSEDQDASRAIDVLRALPKAFLYEYSGTAIESTGRVAKFAFRPNPAFTPPNLETQVLTAMTGEIWIDPSQERITRLEGHLQQDVDFGWGILGRLNKGGWIVIEQADVGNGQWRIVRFQMSMSGRVLFKNRVFDTLEKETQFEPLPVGMGYVEAIRELRSAPAPGGR
ncbi:MAG TPA: hypothetical protein VMU48_22115 [Terracidiphilus sp.]|nr:hypothetical protein [Terracidiphilus sp.]